MSVTVQKLSCGYIENTSGVDERVRRSTSDTSGNKPASRTPRGLAARCTPEPTPVPGARWVPLTRGRFALVDEADFAAVSIHFWQYVPPCAGRTGYAKTATKLTAARAYDAAALAHFGAFAWLNFPATPSPEVRQ